MHLKTILLTVALFAFIVVGMLIYSGIRSAEVERETPTQINNQFNGTPL